MKTIPSFPPDVEQRFWSYVNKTDSCWLWTAATSREHGVFTHDSVPYYAHRIAWRLVRGEDPTSILCHDCPGGDNPLCVNPDHLYLGTDQDNARDRVLKGTQARLSGERNGAAVLTGDDVRLIRATYMAHPSPDTIVALATQLGAGRTTIRHILKCDTWIGPEYIPEGYTPVILRGPHRTFCWYGHPAIPENLYANGECRLCNLDRRHGKR